MEIAITLISGIIGALATFYLNNKLQLGGVMASAGISVLFGGFFCVFPNLINEYLTTNIPVVVMGTSFIGMTTSKLTNQFWVIAIAGFIFSVIFLLTGTYFEGYGGTLGTTAAISFCSTYALAKLSLNHKLLIIINQFLQNNKC